MTHKEAELKITEAQSKRHALIAQAKALNTKAEAEKRDMTADEKDQFTGLMNEVDVMALRINDMPHGHIEIPIGGGYRGDIKSGEVRTLTNGQRFADTVKSNPEDRDLSLGKFFRGMVSGDWSGASSEQRAMAEGTVAGGGIMVPTFLSASVIDAARNAACIMRAGAQTIPMDSSTLKMARVASGPTAAWRAESAAIPTSDLAFEAVTFTAHTLGALCKLSIELFEDAANADAVIIRALGQALGLELDRAALRGLGSSDEPTGILHTANVQTTAVDAVVSHGVFSQAIQKIALENGMANAAIFSPRTAGDLDRLVDLEGRPLQPFPSFLSLNKFATNQIPSNLGVGTNESEIYVGDFTQCLVGMRTQLVVEASREAGNGTGSAFSNMEVWIRAYLRADIQLARPKHFCTLTGIKPVA